MLYGIYSLLGVVISIHSPSIPKEPGSLWATFSYVGTEQTNLPQLVSPGGERTVLANQWRAHKHVYQY